MSLDKKFRFRKFPIYKKSRIFSISLKQLSNKKFPKEEKFSLKSQLWRALDSITLNIAEGSDRSTDKDFANFLNKSHTSLNEVIACLDIAIDNYYLSELEINKYITEAAQLSDELTAFRRNLLKFPQK